MNRTILIVDPNMEVVAKMKKFLEEFGHLVEVSPTRHDALGHIKAYSPGLVISAFALPDGEALVLAEDMRKSADSEAPLLVLGSAKQIEYYSEKAISYKPQGWIKTPLDQMDLYTLVTEWLGKSVSRKPKTTPPQKPKPPKPRRETVRPKAAPAKVEAREAKTPVTSQIGSLERTPVARLFYQVGNRELTGVMTLKHPPMEVEVHFQDGLIVNVVSNYIPDIALGMFLAKNGQLAPRELAGARKRWERDGGLFGQVLLAMDLVGHKELDEAVAAQLLAKLIFLFSWNWRKGAYVFKRDPNSVQAQNGFSLHYERVIFAGIRAHYDKERLMMVFGKRNRLETPVVLKESARADLAGEVNKKCLQSVISAIKRGRNLGEAQNLAALDELEFYRFTYGLYLMDLLTFAQS